ncbi:hypothetical protein NIES4074_49440 [Cylindrospermum sp. NIES-4074]|nr:hypothetical protein NIES4074_49440 [Cylindrospermum sp. NIES-4074]
MIISYLITNDQTLRTKTAPKPLKFRKVYGYKTITTLTEEIYWLTPITTLLANNFSYSKNLIHFTTE